MVYVPEMPRVDAAGAVGSGFDLGQSMGSARTKRKAKNALQRIYEGDKAALADLMAADPEAGRQVDTQMGIAKYVNQGMPAQELAGPTKGGEALTTESVTPSVDVEGLTAYLASRGDSGALKALMEKAGPQAAAKFGFGRDVAINPQTGKPEYFITDESGNVKWTGAAPVPEAPKVEKAPEPKMVEGSDGRIYWVLPGDVLPEGVTTKNQAQVDIARDEKAAKRQQEIDGKYKAVNDLDATLAAYRAALATADRAELANPMSDKAIELGSLATQLQMAYKNAADLGVITGPDWAIINRIIQTPSGATAAIKGPEKLLQQLDQVSALSKRERASLDAIYGGSQNPQSPAGTAMPEGIPPIPLDNYSDDYASYWVARHRILQNPNYTPQERSRRIADLERQAAADGTINPNKRLGK